MTEVMSVITLVVYSQRINGSSQSRYTMKKCLLLSLLLGIPFAASADAPKRAVAVILPTAGYDARGLVTFEESKEGVRIRGNIRGLSAGGHGIHIHEFGDCSSSDASSAGDHFNPDSKPHGGPDHADHHAGDLGNLLATANEATVISTRNSGLSFTGNRSIIGRSVIIHESPDDLKTQPSGNSGKRIGCGVIGIAK